MKMTIHPKAALDMINSMEWESEDMDLLQDLRQAVQNDETIVREVPDRVGG